MGFLNMVEPLGLPEGSVRAVIALGFSALVAYSYVVTNTIDPTLLAFAGPYIGYYFADRQNKSAEVTAAKVIEEAEKPAPPYIPGPDEDR